MSAGGSSPFSASGAATPAAAAAIAKSSVSGEDEDDRVRFRLMLQLSKGADVAAFREDGRQLAGLEVTTLDVDLKVRPLTISLGASLGDLRLSDSALPPDHQYRFLCDLRGGDGGGGSGGGGGDDGRA